MNKLENIGIRGYKGTWYVIDTQIVIGSRYYLLENEQYGDEVPCIIIDERYNIILDEVQNGFDDLRESWGIE